MKDDGTFELGEKLSEEDHGLLRSYWDVTALRRNAINLGVAPDIAAKAEFWSFDEYKERVANAEREAAENAEANPQEQQPNPVPGGSSAPIPGSVSGQQAQGVGLGVMSPVGDGPTPPAEEGSTRAFADPELAGKPYNEWTKAQLEAEVAKRNELRDGDPDYADEDPMSATGTKAEIAERLTDDDDADAPE